MKIICLSGPSGAGKTEILNELPERYRVAPETYMSLNKYGLDNRLMMSKWRYIAWWFDRVLSGERSKLDHLITDRSPLDTVAYVSSGQDELLEVINQSFSELRERGHELHHILITANYPALTSRVAARLAAEPDRYKYHEDDDAHAQRALDFFQRNESWVSIIDTSFQTPQQAAATLENLLSSLLE